MNPFRALVVDALGRREDLFGWRVHQPPLRLDEVENVLVLLLGDKLGDALVVSTLVAALARARPGLPIFVGTSAPAVDYWKRHPQVREVLTLPSGRRSPGGLVRSVVRCLRAGRRHRDRFHVAVSFEPFARPDHFALLRALRPRKVIGFNKVAYRLFDYSLDEGSYGVFPQPIVSRTPSVMRVFGLDASVEGSDFFVPFSQEEEAAARREIGRLPPTGPRLLLNAYGAAKAKSLTPESTARAIRELRAAGHAGPILVSVPQGQEARFGERLEEGATVLGPMRSRFELFALVSMVDAVVSPDTAVGHIAAAFGKPQIALFGRSGTVPVVWRPHNARCATLVSPTEDVNDVDWDGFGQAARSLVPGTVP